VSKNLVRYSSVNVLIMLDHQNNYVGHSSIINDVVEKNLLIF